MCNAYGLAHRVVNVHGVAKIEKGLYRRFTGSLKDRQLFINFLEACIYTKTGGGNYKTIRSITVRFMKRFPRQRLYDLQMFDLAEDIDNLHRDILIDGGWLVFDFAKALCHRPTIRLGIGY